MKVAFLFYICPNYFWALAVLSAISFLLIKAKKDVTTITNARIKIINPLKLMTGMAGF